MGMTRMVSSAIRPQASLGLLAAVMSFAVLARPAMSESATWAENLADGKQEYQENCVSCHGADGKGRGDLGQKLYKKPSDLTTISERNGGDFPFQRIFEIIAGDTPVAGHETIHMPEYAGRMKGDNFKRGYHQAHVRILQLTLYLESIQVKK
jgi:mono/diheme cytochrome c family protein